jgi:hypothetical protein
MLELHPTEADIEWIEHYSEITASQFNCIAMHCFDTPSNTNIERSYLEYLDTHHLRSTKFIFNNFSQYRMLTFSTFYKDFLKDYLLAT